MEPKSIHLLGRLTDDKFVREVASGLALLVKHVESLEESARTLADQDLWRGMAAIRLVADEEAAKFLILLDAVRCPPSMDVPRVRQLKRCHHHVPKGIYVELCYMSPADLAEVTRQVDRMRQKFYLDGPNDVDWIFRNEIESRREEQLYIDYAEDEDECRWVSPSDHDELALLSIERSPASRLVSALARAGATCPRGVRTIAATWRPFTPEASTRWLEVAALSHETIEAVQVAGASETSFTSEDASMIVERWTFPLYGIDLEPLAVDLKELKLRQRKRDCL